MDLALTGGGNIGAEQNRIFRWDEATSSFTYVQNFDLPDGIDSGPATVADIADFNGDNRADVFLAFDATNGSCGGSGCELAIEGVFIAGSDASNPFPSANFDPIPNAEPSPPMMVGLPMLTAMAIWTPFWWNFATVTP